MALTTALAVKANTALFALADNFNLNGLLGEWDLKSFIQNATEYARVIIGAIIVLLGVIAIGWAFYKGVSKLMGGQSSQQTSWGTVVILFLIGGAAMVGGGALIFSIAEGGKTTIEDLGGGMILPMIASVLP